MRQYIWPRGKSIILMIVGLMVFSLYTPYVKAEIVKLTNPLLEVKSVSDKSKQVLGVTNPKQKVIITISKKNYKATATADGEFTIKIPKQKAGTKITVSAKNNLGTNKVMLTVVDKTEPELFIGARVLNTSKYIVGHTEPGATVYVYKGKELLGKGKATKGYWFQLSIPAQKEGTTLTIYAKDKAGNQSVSHFEKVRKADKIIGPAKKVKSIYADAGLGFNFSDSKSYFVISASVRHTYSGEHGQSNFFIDRVGAGANYVLAAKAVSKLTGESNAKLLAGIKKVSTKGGLVIVGDVEIRAGRTIYLYWW